MREKPDAAGDTEAPTEGARRIDLSVPQVAGSALAAVVAAKLASSFGVHAVHVVGNEEPDDVLHALLAKVEAPRQ